MMNETEKSAATAEEIRVLKRQMEEMQKRLEALCSSAPGDSLCACDEREETSGVGEASAATAGEAFGSAAVETDAHEAIETPGPVAAEASATPEDSAVGEMLEVSEKPVAPEASAPLKESIALETPTAPVDGAASDNPAAFVEPVAFVVNGSASRTDAVASGGPEGFAASAASDGAVACVGVANSGAASPQVPDHGQPVAACSPHAVPAASEPASVATPVASGKGLPTPPPAYDAQAFQQGFYAQPTGQQAPYGTPAQAPYAPYGKGPYQQPVVRTKDHVAAGLLGIFLGSLGVHKFYLGYNTPGFIMLGVSILGGLLSFGIASSVVWLIGLIEGVIYLVKGQPEFERLYVFGKRDWF